MVTIISKKKGIGLFILIFLKLSSFKVLFLEFYCESSSAGRASRCQREGRRFESDLSL